MRTRSYPHNATNQGRTHPFGAHGILLALPLSAALWFMIVLPFV
jgi:hypothetical protein